jgi:hypothetical protein
MMNTVIIRTIYRLPLIPKGWLTLVAQQNAICTNQIDAWLRSGTYDQDWTLDVTFLFLNAFELYAPLFLFNYF